MATKRFLFAVGIGLMALAVGTTVLSNRAPAAEPRTATIRLFVADGATVEIDGTPTRSTGADRRFVTPPLTPDQDFTYAVKVTAGKDVRTSQVRVRAGQETTLDLRPTTPVASAAPAADPLADLKAKYRRPAAVPYPKDNPHSADRELLGRTLFFDPRLSGSNWISCASCHNPAFGWGDGLPKAVGHGMQVLGRRSPTVLNLAWAEALFWDGRAGTLEEQALGPIAAAGEMNLPLDQMEAKLRAVPEYKPLFEKAYPGEGVTRDTVAKAIATFERTVVSDPAPFDKWIDGDEAAIPADAKRGFALFNGKANCAKCHSGWRFTDDSFHDLGVAGADKGRGALLPDIQVSQFAFKTPTLRNADRRAPFMHDGCLTTLEAVVEFYDRGGDAKRPSLSAEMKPLHLTPAEKADLVALLKTLTSTDKPVAVPALPR
jgi:cytochrome c peroxidase